MNDILRRIVYLPQMQTVYLRMHLKFEKAGIKEAAKAFWNEVGDKKVFAFNGQMGAGKTTFITALCQEIGVEDTMSSPTFSIINEYRSPSGPVYHIDLYRLKDELEAMHAGVEDIVNSGAVCFVEWPERAPFIFPEDTCWLKLEVLSEDTRLLEESQPIA